MELENEEEKAFCLWVDWKNQVISFHESKGFEKLEYPTHEDMFRFALEKSLEEFGIQ